MTWAKLSASLEPYALHRKIFGFDTFDGFPELTHKDLKSTEHQDLQEGALKSHPDIFQELVECIEEFDKHRYLNKYCKVKLVKGDVSETIPSFLKDNPHVLVALLYMDFDLYKPTKMALQHFLPRIPKGGVIAFDEVNNEYWAGETIAMLEELNLNNFILKKFDFDPNVAYIVL